MTTEQDDVSRTIARFLSGFERGDAQVLLDTISRGPDTVIIGTDLNEYWTSFTQLEEPFKLMAHDIVNAKYRWHNQGPNVFVRGSFAWAHGSVTLEYGEPANLTSADMRTTFVLHKNDGVWRIEHGHFSRGIQSNV